LGLSGRQLSETERETHPRTLIKWVKNYKFRRAAEDEEEDRGELLIKWIGQLSEHSAAASR
jgi:hypothetical protein